MRICENMQVMIKNAYAQSLLPLADGIAHTPLAEALQKAMEEKQNVPSGVLVMEKQNLLVNTIPMVVEGETIGAVATIKRAEDIQEDEKLIRQELAQKGLYAKYCLDSIQGSSKAIRDLKKLASTYVRTDANVLVLGESGTAFACTAGKRGYANWG